MILVEPIRNSEDRVYARLMYNADQNYLLMKWVGSCTREEMKHASLRMLDWQMREGFLYGTHFHVHDTKELEGAWTGLVDWITDYFFTENYKYGLRYNISVLSPDIFSKHSSMQLERKSSDKVITVLSETLSQAEMFIAEKRREEVLTGAV